MKITRHCCNTLLFSQYLGPKMGLEALSFRKKMQPKSAISCHFYRSARPIVSSFSRQVRKTANPDRGVYRNVSTRYSQNRHFRCMCPPGCRKKNHGSHIRARVCECVILRGIRLLLLLLLLFPHLTRTIKSAVTRRGPQDGLQSLWSGRIPPGKKLKTTREWYGTY